MNIKIFVRMLLVIVIPIYLLITSIVLVLDLIAWLPYWVATGRNIFESCLSDKLSSLVSKTFSKIKKYMK